MKHPPARTEQFLVKGRVVLILVAGVMALVTKKVHSVAKGNWPFPREVATHVRVPGL